MTDDLDAPRFAEGLIQLFIDYVPKLERMYAEVKEQKKLVTRGGGSGSGSGGTLELMPIRDRFYPLQAALLDATRVASQLAEQGAVGDLARFQLRIRLAEVEGLIAAIQSAVYM